MFPDLMRDDVFRLETDRLWLRWPRASDAARIAELAGDRGVAQMTARIPHPYPPGAAAEFVLTARAANLSGRELVLAMTRKQRPDEMIGCVSLCESDPGSSVLGFWLGKPFWGAGFMTEGVRALVDIAMRASDVEAIVACARPENAACRRVLEKVGFVSEGFGVEIAPARGGAIGVERYRFSRRELIRQGARDAARSQAASACG
jgi:RimJ/RimL family protein N-acetyltransferase